MIREFASKFTEKILIDEEKTISLQNEFYILPEDLQKIFKRISMKPVYAGEYLGKSGVNKFIPSLHLLNLLNKNTDKKALLNDKGEWLFICGRDVLKESVIQIGDVKKDELVLVVNKYDECIGAGVFKNDKKCFIKNYFDLGDFLRRERRR